jgi:ABC-type branched-subunit amino acid transport system substrate-binding protein
VNEGVVAFVGSACSGAAIPASGVARQHADLPFITPAASSPKFTEQGYDNVFRLIYRDDQEGPADASYLKTVLNVQKVAIIHDGTTYAQGLASYLRDAAGTAGLQVVLYDALTPGQKDYKSLLTRVGTTGADALMYTAYYPEFALLAKEYAQLKPNYKLVGAGAVYDPQLVQIAGSALDDSGISMTKGPTTGFIHNSLNDSFVSTYVSKFGSQPVDFASYEYDGIETLAAALKADGGKTDGNSLNKALRSVNYNGLTGPVSFDSKGDRPEPIFYALHAQGNPPTVSIYAARLGGTWKLTSTGS